MAIKIRTATRVDETACLRMVELLTAETRTPTWSATFKSLISGERGEALIAEEEGAVCGLATVSYNLAIRYGGEYAQLEELIVDPAVRGKSVGGLLVEEALAHARARGCPEFGLYLLEATEHNRPFYEKYGFRVVGSEMRQRL